MSWESATGFKDLSDQVCGTVVHPPRVPEKPKLINRMRCHFSLSDREGTIWDSFVQNSPHVAAEGPRCGEMHTVLYNRCWPRWKDTGALRHPCLESLCGLFRGKIPARTLQIQESNLLDAAVPQLGV